MLAGIILSIGIIVTGVASFFAFAVWSRALGDTKASSRIQQQQQQQADLLAQQIRRETKQHKRSTGAWNGWRKLLVTNVVQESEDCRSFYLQDPDLQALAPFLPGQYLPIRISVDQQTISRCYSLSSAPNGREYRITVKRVPGGKASDWIHTQLRPGASVEARSPIGKFVVPDDQTSPLNMIAAGIGITPMISMIESCRVWQPARKLRLFYQVRDLEYAPFLIQLSRWAAEGNTLELYLYLSQHRGPKPSWAAGIGRMTAAQIIAWARTSNKKNHPQRESMDDLGQFFICGPPPMLQQLTSDFAACGIQPERITVETFDHTPTKKTATNQQPASNETANVSTASVCFERSGKEGCVDSSEDSLLTVAEKVGVALDSACRNGDCGTCLVKLLRGKTHYLQQPSYEPISDGEVLACVACPETDVVIDA